MPQKLFVFDWNGTLLADTKPSWEASNACLAYFGRPPISLQHFRETFNFPVIHFYKLNGVDVDEMLAQKAESNVLFQSTYERLAARTRLRKGALQLLRWLEEHEYERIILSNYLTEKIMHHTKRLGVDQFFSHIDANTDDGTHILQHTTKTERLQRFMTERGFQPENTTIIGDSAEEPEIARHLGLTAIGITDGTITRARLKKAAPHHIVHSLAEVPALLKKSW
jgi:phosphoglycolate phosphatase-like HAD superfamily hydrolase